MDISKAVSIRERSTLSSAVGGGPIVVGVNVGAGDLDAALRLLTAAPERAGMSFVLIQRHDNVGEVVDLLARNTAFPVAQIENGMALSANHIYVSSPDALVGVQQSVFCVQPQASAAKTVSPFDYFLLALAREYGARSVAVSLAGAEEDGESGLRSIRERGGLVIAQDACASAGDNAKCRASGRSAVDLTLPVERIPDILLWLSAGKGRHDFGASPQGAQALAGIVRYLSAPIGSNIAPYKDSTLLRRVFRRMTRLGTKNLPRYLGALQVQADESRQLTNDMVVHVTSYFRDPKAYDFLAKTVIPKLVRQHPRSDAIRIWIPGCSTGEEAYSIAMLFIEEIARAKRDLRLQIFATDISKSAIARGRAGLYSESIRRHVAPARLRRFFIKEQGGYRVSAQLRESVLFAPHNLFSDPPFSRLDMIVCRNVLIYMQRDVQEKTLSQFHFALRERGVLFIGTADTIGLRNNGFAALSYGDRIFERVSGQQARPSPVLLLRTREGPQMTLPRAEQEIPAPLLQEAMLQSIHQMYGAASIIVNRRHEILRHSGLVDRYLKVPCPEIGAELGSVLPDGVMANVQAALRRAAQQKATSTLLGAKVERAGESVSIVVSAQPITIDNDELLLLSFGDEQQDHRVSRPESDEQQRSLRSIELEEELVSTRKRLERTIRDLEVVNEELIVAHQEALSVNEELQSMNEELEASQEEMQSLNEELMILNQQLQDAVEQQRNSAIDLRNILNSSDVATLFLDRDFNIRFFTPPATALFGLIASDVGRPLADLARRFTDDRLLDDARAVLDNLLPSRREIFTREDNWYLRKIAPYRTQGGRAEGVVITFTDITETKLVERDIRAARAFAESVVETVREPLLVLDETQHVNVVNKALRDLFNADANQFIGLALSDTPASQLAPLLQDILRGVHEGRGHVDSYRVEIDFPSTGRLALALAITTRAIGGNTSAAGMILLILEDITEKERIEQGLMSAKKGSEHANLIKSQFLAAASHDLRQPLQTLRLICDILQRKLTDEETRVLNAKCGETINGMIGVVNTILDINQLEAGAIRPSMQNFSANTLVERLYSEFNFLVQAKGLSWRVAKCSKILKSDPRLLIQILRNLIGNAIKFTSSGKLLFGFRRRGDKVSIEIWDSGPGILDADRERIFDFFQKGENSAAGSEDGLGLGLAIVTNLSRILGHEIKLTSRIGKGSCFSVLVPVGERVSGHLTAVCQPSRSIAKERGARILIVEDEPSVRESLELLLVGEGHEVAAASNGREALAIVRSDRRPPEIILVDYSIIGGMNGLEVIDEVRAAVGRDIPAAVLTGDVSSAAFSKIAIKANIHLTKPVQADALLDAIGRLRAQSPPLRTVTPPAPPPRTPVKSSTTKKVCVVDDDEDVRDSMRSLLESYGYQAVTYRSGREYLDSERADCGSCLILDERMPDMDGFDVLAQVVARNSRSAAIMITGAGDVQTAVRAMKAGAFDFIEKPVHPDQLRMSIDRALLLATNSDEHDSQLADAVGSVARLTKRQRAVMDLIVSGHPNKVIANRLGIGQRTVESHRATIMKKLGAKTFADLIRLALAASEGRSRRERLEHGG